VNSFSGIDADSVDIQTVIVEKNQVVYVFTVKKIYHPEDLIPYSIVYYNTIGEVVGEFTRE